MSVWQIVFYPTKTIFSTETFIAEILSIITVGTIFKYIALSRICHFHAGEYKRILQKRYKYMVVSGNKVYHSLILIGCNIRTKAHITVFWSNIHRTFFGN